MCSRPPTEIVQSGHVAVNQPWGNASSAAMAIANTLGVMSTPLTSQPVGGQVDGVGTGAAAGR
jgi:hypothetical protein